MEFYRVGDKTVSKEKLMRAVDRILSMRQDGMSQQEVAQKVGCDRTFISRLEAIGEVRKGGSIAVIGFPLLNTEELTSLAQEMGVDFLFLMTDQERWSYIQSFDGVQFLNELSGIVTKLQDFDTVIMIGSDMRIRIAEALLGEKVLAIQLGESPIVEDIYFPPEKFRELIMTAKGGR